MTDREQLLDELALVFARAAVDRLLLEEGLGAVAPAPGGEELGQRQITADTPSTAS